MSRKETSKMVVALQMGMQTEELVFTVSLEMLIDGSAGRAPHDWLSAELGSFLQLFFVSVCRSKEAGFCLHR